MNVAWWIRFSYAIALRDLQNSFIFQKITKTLSCQSHDFFKSELFNVFELFCSIITKVHLFSRFYDVNRPSIGQYVNFVCEFLQCEWTYPHLVYSQNKAICNLTICESNFYRVEDKKIWCNFYKRRWNANIKRHFPPPLQTCFSMAFLNNGQLGK